MDISKSIQEPVVIHWFRRDLRLHDNTSLIKALESGYKVLPVFIFDDEILAPLKKQDPRISFIYQALNGIHLQLAEVNSGILIQKGTPLKVMENLAGVYNVQAVYANHDYEPYAVKRDEAVNEMLSKKGIAFVTAKDQVIFEKNEISKIQGGTYTIFTPYSNAWKSKFQSEQDSFKPQNISKSHLFKFASGNFNFPSLESLGFTEIKGIFQAPAIDECKIKEYDAVRDFPHLDATSRLSIHLRFGTISIREIIHKALVLNVTWLNELIWREFFMQILWHYPHVVENSFKPVYDRIQWRNNEAEFSRWCEGKTGYPLVDAGMRELAATGFMHNRVRMITASFLVKDLLIDWRWGESWFAEKLMDFELSSNNGNWQWAAGTGCDSAPYFRIFNPDTQTQRFDPNLIYIRKWIPELESGEYPSRIVDHSFARKRCLEAYAVVKG
ncbi:MAG: deoxyribodipyrimidine photo-lyase [Bacteroidales bacterium]|nr:deoxyribodipyrimidine photo-lyase [Bacteroidales bacterium]